MNPSDLDRLLAAADDSIRLADLLAVLDGDPHTEFEQSVAGPLAFLACRKFLQDAGDDGALDAELAAALLRGLTRQESMLALLESIDELLASTEFLVQYGARTQAAFLAGHDAARDTRPLIAAALAEGALRLAIHGTGHPLHALVALTPADVTALAPAYAECLPRLIGAALDHWGSDRAAGPLLREVLSSLLETPASSDAAFECGLDRLRQAVAVTDPIPDLIVARQHFAHAQAAEHDRPDAALYGAGIDAVMAFFRGDQRALRAARSEVRAGVAHWRVTRRRSHVPSWRRPRAEAALAWSRLVAILERAGDMINQPVWVDAWQSLDAVLDAYLLDRTVMPVVAGNQDDDALAGLVRPVIEASLIRRQALLAQISLVLKDTDGSVRADQLRVLHDRLDRLSTARPSAPATTDIGRLMTVAPSLLAELTAHDAARLADRLDDDLLRLLEGIAYNSRIRRAALREPVTARLLDGLRTALLDCADYIGEVRHAIDDLLTETVMFLVTRHDLQRSAAIGYLHAGGTTPVEAMLQDDFADWLRRGPLVGRIAVEVPNVATGRADIVVSFGTTRFIVEVKRELHDSSNTALERSYLAQAADYSGTSATFGILLVLDLTAHPDGVRHLRECAWVSTHRPVSSARERHVVVAVVPGNRMTPSGYSRMAHAPSRRQPPGTGGTT